MGEWLALAAERADAWRRPRSQRAQTRAPKRAPGRRSVKGDQVSALLTDDWWALGERLAELAADLAGVEPPPATQARLTPLIVEVLTLVTCWPTQGRPAAPLPYLRARRARMTRYAPWLYAFAPPTRKLLVGTDRLPSVLSFAVGSSYRHRGTTSGVAQRSACPRPAIELDHDLTSGRTGPRLVVGLSRSGQRRRDGPCRSVTTSRELDRAEFGSAFGLSDVPAAWPIRPRTDLGNAERLVDRFGSELRYCRRQSRWRYWDGRHWATDWTGEAERRAKATVRSMYAEASRASDPEERRALRAVAISSESRQRLQALLTLAQTEAAIAVAPADLDTDHWLAATNSGTVELRSGRLPP